MTRLLAVDPGRKAGWSLWGNEKHVNALLGSDVICGDDPFAARDLISQVEPDVVVIEEQQQAGIRRAGKLVAMPWRSLRTLVLRADIWNVCARLHGARVLTVYPATWQAYMRIRRTKGMTVKDVVQSLARQWRANVQPDEADAILIGKWAMALEVWR